MNSNQILVSNKTYRQIIFEIFDSPIDFIKSSNGQLCAFKNNLRANYTCFQIFNIARLLIIVYKHRKSTQSIGSHYLIFDFVFQLICLIKNIEDDLKQANKYITTLVAMINPFTPYGREEKINKLIFEF